MKLVVMFLLVEAAVIVSGFGHHYWHHLPPSCQKYCYYQRGNQITLQCCNSLERSGQCPRGCIFTSAWLDLSSIACNCDRNCVPGYKCCHDPCYKHFKICKPAIHLTPAKPCPTLPPQQPETTVEITTTTPKTTASNLPITTKVVDTTIAATTTSPTTTTRVANSTPNTLASTITTTTRPQTTKPATTPTTITTTLPDTTTGFTTTPVVTDIPEGSGLGSGDDEIGNELELFGDDEDERIPPPSKRSVPNKNSVDLYF